MLRFTILLVFLYVLLSISKAMSHTKCGPVCAIYCKYGNELDVNGCPTCTCRKEPEKSSSPCRDRQTYSCDHGPIR